MKRFWKTAALTVEEGGWGIRLDGRSVRTPARSLLLVPSEQLGLAITREWSDVGEHVDPRAMPLTGLANAAIDQVAPDKEAFAKALARYSEGDLTCYRVEGPAELSRWQQEGWDPLLAWARRRYDVDFATTTGIVHVAQPRATVQRLGYAVAALDAFQLAGLSPLVTIGGSLITGLAALENAVGVEEAWSVVTIDERWQLERWGSDQEAEAALENRRRDFLAAAQFLELLDPVNAGVR